MMGAIAGVFTPGVAGVPYTCRGRYICTRPLGKGPARGVSVQMVRPAIAQRVMSTRTTDGSAPFTARGFQSAPAHDILVIEDDPGVADMLRLALQSEGHTLHVADDGEEGLTYLQHRRCRILLLDLLLPGLDGMGVLRALRAEPAWRPAVVIILSALQVRADVMR